MPKGVPVDVVGYWFPKDGKGPIANDTNTVLRSSSNPVLAHLFVNYLMDETVALKNISYNGYMQPLNGDHPGAAGEGTDPAAEPDVDRGGAVGLPPRARRAAASRRRRRALAAGLARRESAGSSMSTQAPPEPPQQPLAPRLPDGRSASRSRSSRTSCSGSCWPRPACIWLVVLFVIPFYAVLAIGEGKLNAADRVAGRGVTTRSTGARRTCRTSGTTSSASAGVRAARSPGGPSGTSPLASLLSLVIAYPAAYFVARFAGRRKGLFLVLLIAPFWISYMMRMLAWIDLLQTNGYVNKALSFIGPAGAQTGSAATPTR